MDYCIHRLRHSSHVIIERNFLSFIDIYLPRIPEFQHCPFCDWLITSMTGTKNQTKQSKMPRKTPISNQSERKPHDTAVKSYSAAAKASLPNSQQPPTLVKEPEFEQIEIKQDESMNKFESVGTTQGRLRFDSLILAQVIGIRLPAEEMSSTRYVASCMTKIQSVTCHASLVRT